MAHKAEIQRAAHNAYVTLRFILQHCKNPDAKPATREALASVEELIEIVGEEAA